jgi:hypothetical protein
MALLDYVRRTSLYRWVVTALSLHSLSDAWLPSVI